MEKEKYFEEIKDLVRNFKFNNIVEVNFKTQKEIKLIYDYYYVNITIIGKLTTVDNIEDIEKIIINARNGYGKIEKEINEDIPKELIEEKVMERIIKKMYEIINVTY